MHPLSSAWASLMNLSKTVLAEGNICPCRVAEGTAGHLAQWSSSHNIRLLFTVVVLLVKVAEHLDLVDNF